MLGYHSVAEASDTTTRETDAPAGYRLGDPIALHDLLALPPDGRWYARDAGGRLTLMSPDDSRSHRIPMSGLAFRLYRGLDPKAYRPIQEPSLVFDRVYTLAGGVLPPSRFGKKGLEPDFAVFAGKPTPDGGRISLAGVHLVIELISPGTFRSDLGIGTDPEAVDRWRTYLEGGVPEYWVLNLGVEAAPIPPRSGLFLANDGGAWRALPGASATAGFRGLALHTTGLVRSGAIPGLVLDLDGFWAEL